MSIIEDCKTFARMIGPYLDGQLDVASLAMAEAHMVECETCRERVQVGRAMRGTLKKLSKETAPDGLRARMASAMTAEAARSTARAHEAARTRWLSTWKTMAPLAGAAAVGLLFMARHTGSRPTQASIMRAGMGDDFVSELVVGEHARPLPPEQTDPAKVRAMAQYVGVPIQPANLTKSGARLVGGRLLPFHNERAAMLQYEYGNGAEAHRVSLFIYDPRRIQVQTEGIAARPVGPANVRVGRQQGYTIAVTERGGVGYALATDFEEEQSAQLAALIEEPRDE